MPRPPRTILVALVHDDQVWLDGAGALPTFVHDPEQAGPTATATASRLLAESVHLAPVVLLEEDHRLHVLGPRAGASGPVGEGAWAPVADLPSDHREHVRTAVRQHRGTPPPHRPPWYSPGWHDDVESWIDGVLATRGRARTGPLRTHRVWSISAVFTVATDDGDLWFKASCEHFGAEAGIVETVAAHLPHLVMDVVATDPGRCWLLTEPLAGVSDDGAPAEAAEILAPLWSAAQVDSATWLEELRAAGAPDRGLEPTLTAWREVVATDPELAALTAQERSRLAQAVPEVEARLRELWSCGFPDTLAHGDLHSGNVAFDGRRVRIFDWSDGCLTHPFLDATHLAHWLAEEHGGEAADQVRTVLAPWRAACPDADFDRAVELAPLADLVFQTVTFAGIARSTEPGTGDFDGVVAWLTRQVIDAVLSPTRVDVL